MAVLRNATSALMRFATGSSNLNDQRQLHTRTEAIFIAGQVGIPNALRKVPARSN
jgi:hypothetical protein